MGDVVNLRRARKEKAKAEKEAKAAQNRLRFGRAKADRAADAAQEAQKRERLEAHRREPFDSE